MLIDFKYGKEFDSVMEGLEKHPQYKELSDLDGIGKQTDMVGFPRSSLVNQVRWQMYPWTRMQIARIHLL